jgi:hypothetical protein
MFPALLADAAPPFLFLTALGGIVVVGFALIMAILFGGLWTARRIRKPGPPR